MNDTYWYIVSWFEHQEIPMWYKLSKTDGILSVYGLIAVYTSQLEEHYPQVGNSQLAKWTLERPGPCFNAVITLLVKEYPLQWVPFFETPVHKEISYSD